MNPDFSASRACAQFASSLQYQDIPDQVIDFVKRDLLDWLGCAIGGVRVLPLGQSKVFHFYLGAFDKLKLSD